MSDFHREHDRYIVIKHKDLGSTRLGALRQFLAVKGIPTRECVVVEPDWPIFEQAWDMVQRLAEGRPQQVDELHDKATALRIHLNTLYFAAMAVDDCEEATDEMAEAWGRLLTLFDDGWRQEAERQKLLWQAEALEDAANYFQHGEGKKSGNLPVSLRGLAIRLRHQTEEKPMDKPTPPMYVFRGMSYMELRDYVADLEAREQALAAHVERFPLGAVINGQELLRRLADHYQFECEGGSLSNCVEFQGLERCFVALLEYAQAATTTNLARRDLLMKSEGIEDYLEHARKAPPDELMDLRDYSDWLRSQAEGGDHDQA